MPGLAARAEFGQTGVYVLVGPSEETDLPTIYVGEGDPVGSRLKSHVANKDFWTWVVLLVTEDGSLNKAHVQYLEARLVQLAKEAHRSTLENATVPTLPTLSEAEVADAESFLADMLSIYPLLGLSSLEKPPTLAAGRTMLYLKKKGTDATGCESAQGFVVRVGSRGRLDEVFSIPVSISKKRTSLKEQGVPVPEGTSLLLTQGYVFNSVSTAAAVLLGRNANGWVEWKDVEGKTMKQLPKAAAHDEGLRPLRQRTCR